MIERWLVRIHIVRRPPIGMFDDRKLVVFLQMIRAERADPIGGDLVDDRTVCGIRSRSGIVGVDERHSFCY